MNEKCVICEGYCPSTGCTGRPGYVRVRNLGWVSYDGAVKVDEYDITGTKVDWSDIWSYSRYGLTPEKDRIVIVDTETTHLDTSVAEMIEVAWAEPGGRINSAIVEHSTHHADPEALRINRYEERWLSDPAKWAPKHHNLPDIITAAVEGATILGSFVDYDRAIINGWLGTNFFYPARWHHRPLEIGSWVAGRYGVPHSLSLADARLLVQEREGVTLVEPDHTAAGDVRAVESIWFAAQANA